jgi:hypothetical protein
MVKGNCSPLGTQESYREIRRVWGQNIPFKIMPLVTYFLFLGSVSDVPLGY